MVKHGLQRIRQETPWGLLLAATLAAWGWVGIAQAQSVAPQGGQAKASTKAAAKRAPAKRVSGGAPMSARMPQPEIVGRRDPFKLPPPPVPGQEGAGEITGPLPPGTRGLVIGRLRLEGIVRLDTTNMMIAVVDTSANRAYFLRENDQVYNGVVSKITPDAVYFTQNVLDRNGRVVTREVVKRLGQGPGEGR